MQIANKRKPEAKRAPVPVNGVNGHPVNGAIKQGPQASNHANTAAAVKPVLRGEELAASVRMEIEAATPEIIGAIIGKAIQGSYLHANFLFEFARISGAPKSAEAEADEPLAKLLLEALEAEPPASE